MTKKGKKANVLAGIVALASLVVPAFSQTPVSGIPVETKENGRLNVPVYSLNDVPKSYCARYVKSAGKRLFDENYANASAWDMKDNERFVTNIGDYSLEAWADAGVLKPGMVVAAHYPKSRFRSKNVTHVLLYLGKDKKDGKGRYAHEWGPRTEVATENDLRAKYGLNFRYILDSRGGK